MPWRQGVSNGEVTLMEFVWGDIARESHRVY